MTSQTQATSERRIGGVMSVTLLVLLASAIPAMTGCSHKDKDDAAAAEVTVQAERPVQGPIVEHITADAVLAPLAQAAITPKISAPVKKFLVQRGSKVKAGELLAVLENADLQAAALDNKGSFTAAKAAFETATRAQVPEDFQKGQLDLAQAKANFDLAQSIVNSRKELFAQGAIPGRDLDTASAALVQAQAVYDAAKQHLESLQKVSHQAALQTAEGQLTSAQGKYEGAAAQMSYSEVRSPIDGVVVDRPLYAGETAAAGTALLTVMDTSALLAKVHIAQVQAQRLALGGAATVDVPGVDNPVPAKVSLISPALDPGSTTVEVWLRIENPKSELKVGTPVRASIAGERVPNALLIPASAILTGPGGATTVMIVGSGSVAESRPVTTGLKDNGQAQILSGISASDMVITSGAYALDPQTKVKIGKPDTEEHSGDKPSAAAGEAR